MLMNGLTHIAQRPDLLDRTVLITLSRISSVLRMVEDDLWRNFEESLPEILGGAFDIISRAIRIQPERLVRGQRFSSLCHADRLPDFHAWLCEEISRRDPGSRIRAGVKASHNLGPYKRLVTASTEICSSETFGLEP